MTLSKSQIVAQISKKSGLTRKASGLALSAFWEAVQESLVAGEPVSFVGFGTFEVRDRAARTGRNPQTGEEIEIAAARAPVFKAGKTLKNAVNK